MSDIIKIRAHHLLCLQGYQGYGYSDSFQANLEQIISLINTDSDLEMEVIADNDIICSCCPYTSKSGCQKQADSAQKIHSMDLKVLKKLDLTEGTRDKVQNLVRLTHIKFKTYLDLQEICGGCSWEQQCLWVQKFQNFRD